jgi:alkyl hydroperoxide reductase subunit AhpF
MEKLLPESVVKQIDEVFQKLNQPVQVFLFTAKVACDYCGETQQLLEEVIAIAPEKLTLQVCDLDENADLAKHYSVEHAPTIVIAAKEGDQITDFGIRFLGIPSGHEFTSLIQSLIMVSMRDSGLNDQTRKFLKGLTQPLLLQVFATPT